LSKPQLSRAVSKLTLALLKADRDRMNYNLFLEHE
jgi:hypothetical protein